MTALADSVVDWAALLEVVYSSFLAGIGVTAVFAVAILGATRAVDARRDGGSVVASFYAALTVLAFAVVIAAVGFGIVVMTTK